MAHLLSHALRTPQHNQNKAREWNLPSNIAIVTFSLYYFVPSGIAYLDVARLKPDSIVLSRVTINCYSVCIFSPYII
jgi:hypothetical protein